MTRSSQLRMAMEQKKKNKENLEESEIHYRTIVENQTELICHFTEKRILIFVNEAYCRFFGKSFEELVGYPLELYVPDEDKAKIMDHLNALSKEDPIGMLEHQVFAAGDEIRWLQWINQALFDKEGNLIEYQSVGRDITHSKEVEQALRESKAQNLALMKAIPDIMLRLNREGGCITNGGSLDFSELPWLSNSDIAPQTDQIFPERVAHKYDHYLQKALETHQMQEFEYDLLIKNKLHTYEARLTAINSEEVLAIIRDITEWKQTEARLVQHAQRLEALTKIQQHILSVQAPASVAQTALECLEQLIPFNYSSVAQYDYENNEIIILKVYTTLDINFPEGTRMPFETIKRSGLFDKKEVVYFEDINRTDNPMKDTLQKIKIRSLINIPLMIRDKRWGAINIGSNNIAAFTEEHIKIIQEVANQIAIAMHNAYLFKEVRANEAHLKQLTGQLVSVQEDDRKRISQELHDDVGQILTGLKIGLELVRSDLADENLIHRLNQSIDLTDTLMDKTRSLARNLRPPALDTVGLNLTLQDLCQTFAKQTDLKIDYQGQDLTILSETINICLYRFVQEALNNVAKHAQATHIKVRLKEEDKKVSLSVEDNGRGFNPVKLSFQAHHPQQLGLLGMRERLSNLGGCLKIDPRPEKGTKLVAYIPCKEVP